MCALLAFPPPPPGSNVFDAPLPPDLVVAGYAESGKVVVDLAEGYARLPPGFRPSWRVIFEELLPEMEKSSGITKCMWCLYPSTVCTFWGRHPLQGGLPQSQASVALGSQVATSPSGGVGYTVLTGLPPSVVPASGVPLGGTLLSSIPRPGRPPSRVDLLDQAQAKADFWMVQASSAACRCATLWMREHPAVCGHSVNLPPDAPACPAHGNGAWVNCLSGCEACHPLFAASKDSCHTQGDRFCWRLHHHTPIESRR